MTGELLVNRLESTQIIKNLWILRKSESYPIHKSLLYLLCFPFFRHPSIPRILRWLELLDEQRAALDDGLPLHGEDDGSDDGGDGESSSGAELGPLEHEM